MNADMAIIRPRLTFEQEFGTHRNWWVRDARLTGNPLSILLYLLSHDQNHRVTQTEAQHDLELGESAWRTAKHKLMEAGFLIEIRDRYTTGRRRGQKRFRLLLQDPEPGTFISREDAIIDAYEHPELLENLFGESQSGKSRVAPKASLDNQEWVTKPQVRASRENQEWVGATLENQESLIGIENQVRLGNGLLNNQTNPTNHRASVDAQLAELVPGLGLTFEAIAQAVNGRVDLESVDVVAAVKATLLRAKHSVAKPADYVASSIVNHPQKWSLSAAAPVAYTPANSEVAESSAHQLAASERNACARGEHDWGPSSWRETDRAYCTRAQCYVSRASVDEEYAAFEDRQFTKAGGR